MSRYNFADEQVTSQGIVILLTLLERSAYTLAGCCQNTEIKSKNHDELINFTGVVSISCYLLILSQVESSLLR